MKELDAFTKIPEDYRKQSAVGGTCKLLIRRKIQFGHSIINSQDQNSAILFSFTGQLLYNSLPHLCRDYILSGQSIAVQVRTRCRV